MIMAFPGPTGQKVALDLLQRTDSTEDALSLGRPSSVLTIAVARMCKILATHYLIQHPESISASQAF
eukprot:CAMPEP_0175112872 /NCGR_PEP_ID=MMETSP0086_2-20121207/15790_1 /TAXON_ID=136419 /ORGANISM="Unknown Unknown, Strain D1" /LENGTH=66 /DNA_ID=CAMNT_0016391955 /DNA_START=33 /DNA_END=231 /DNA_ORIENTATION=-